MNAMTRPITLAPRSPKPPENHARKLINAAFCGRLTPEDQLHMARAILQLSDEMHEVREELRAVKRALTARGAAT